MPFLRQMLTFEKRNRNNMNYTIHKAVDRQTITWASGTSTEIFIFPSDGDFVSRNFTFRISTATVEAESSTFTFFEGITRHLMILKGNLILTHEGHYTKEMKPYDQDTFSGEWPTSSVGKVTDFNLMLKHGATGSLNHQHVEGQAQIQHYSGAERTFVYIAAGQLRFQDQLLETGDLLAYDATTLELKAEVDSDLIFIEVDLNTASN